MLEAVFAAVVRFILEYLLFGRLIGSIRRSRAPRLPQPVSLGPGVIHSWHFTRELGKHLLRYEKWTIEKDPNDITLISTEDPIRPGLRYKGRFLTQDQDHSVIELIGTEPGELGHYRFERHIPGSLVKPVGLILAKDFDKKAYCSLALISGEKLPDNEVEKILRSRTGLKWRLVLQDWA